MNRTARNRVTVRSQPRNDGPQQQRLDSRKSSTLAFAIGIMLFSGPPDAHSQALPQDDAVTLDEDAPPFALNAYGVIGAAYDSNPLRISEAEADLLMLDREDNVFNVGAGINSRYRVSRQLLSIDARVERFQYGEFSENDHTAGRARLQWDWQSGQLWSGDIGGLYNRKLRDFANQLDPVAELREETRLFASVARSLGVGWTVDVSASTADISFEETSELDLTRNAGELAFIYETPLKSSFGVAARVVGGTFDTSDARNFTETSVQAVLSWPMSALTTFDVRAGFTERDHESADRPDFSGATGRLALTRTAARENRFTLAIYREPSNLGDEIANYAVVEGVSLMPQWSVSETVVLRLDGHMERRDFRGVRQLVPDPDFVDLEQREDEIVGGGVWMDWNPPGRFSLSLGFEAEERTSSRDTEEYDFERVSLQLRADL